MLESASRDIVNWQLDRQSNSTKFQLLTKMITTLSWKIGIKFHSQVLEDHDASPKKWGKKDPSRGIIQKCEPQERVPWTQNSRKERRMKSSGKSGGPAKQRGTWQRMSMYFKKESCKLRSNLLPKFWVVPAPSSKKKNRRATFRDRLWSFYAYVRRT